MNWAVLSSIFFLASFKFMFSAIPGAVADLPYLHTYLAMVSGGTISAGFFYFLSELFMKISHKKRVKKHQAMIAKGLHPVEKKKFTKMNKFVVRLKRSIGMYGIAFWAPFFLSIPIGSIITAKFYGKKLITFPLVVLGIFMNAVVVVYLSYIFN
jgi:hypothetical protein